VSNKNSPVEIAIQLNSLPLQLFVVSSSSAVTVKEVVVFPETSISQGSAVPVLDAVVTTT